MINLIENDGTLVSPQGELQPLNDDSGLLSLLSNTSKTITPRHLGLNYIEHLSNSSKGRLLYVSEDSTDTLTSHGCLSGAQAFASFLKSRRISSTSAVVLLLNNHHHFFIPVIGAWLRGCSVSLLQPSASPDTIESQLRVLKKELRLEDIILVVGNEFLSKVPLKDDVISCLVTLSPCDDGVMSLDSIMNEYLNDERLEEDDEEEFRGTQDIAVTFWTSGSTGEPKGVLYTASHILKSIHYCSYIPPEITTAIQNYEASSLRLMILTNFFHPGGFTEGLRNTFLQKRTGIILHKDCPIFRSIEITRPGMIICSPEFAVGLSNGPDKAMNLSSVVALYPIGGAVSPSYTKKAKGVFPSLQLVCRGYGSTETLSISLGTSSTHLGTLFPTYQLRILGPSGETLGPNEVGKVAVRPGFGMKGYLGSGSVHSLGPDGFFLMGDVGYYDSQGRIFFKCRSKDLIKVHNHHIYPQEIEAFILSKCPEVKEVGVFGRRDQDGLERLAAVVVPLRVEQGMDLSCTVREMFEREKGIPSYKKLDGGLRIAHALPRNANGKIIRGRLATLFIKL